MADTKLHPEEQIRRIHAIFDEDLTDAEIIENIREVLYGKPDEEDEEDEDDGQKK